MMRRYKRHGALAISPLALASEHEQRDRAGLLATAGDVAVITVRGPLCAVGCDWWVGYDTVSAAVRAALDGGCRGILMRIDSPGGEVAGMVDAVREIRAAARAAGVPIVAHVEGQACSAAYGLASAADTVMVSATAVVGSVGVIADYTDVTGSLEQAGLRVTVLRSGARKADGHPAVPLDDPAVEALQSVVDACADEFRALVAEMRGVPLSAIEDLEAGVRVGAAAVPVLADSVGSAAGARAVLGAMIAPMATHTASTGADTGAAADEDEIRAALVAATEDEDEEKAARARRALAAYDSDPEDTEEKESAAAAAAANAQAAQLAAQVAAQGRELAALRAERAAAERAAILATRPDLGDGAKAALASVTDLKSLRAIVESLPRVPAAAPSGQPEAVAARGSGDQDPLKDGSDVSRVIAARLGIAETKKPRVIHDGNRTIFGVRE